MHFLQVEVKRALPKEVQQQQAALRAAVAGRGMLPAAIGELTIIQHTCADRILKKLFMQFFSSSANTIIILPFFFEMIEQPLQLLEWYLEEEEQPQQV